MNWRSREVVRLEGSERRTPVLEKGLLQVYTGNGKGKTTAALGLALRMSGHGGRVAVIQFMKGWDFYGEIEALKRIPGLRHERTGTPDYVRRGQESPVDRSEAKRGLDLARECLGGEFDLVVLDELNVVLDFGLLELEPVMELLRSRPPHVEVLVTGRGAPQALLEAADLVTEMREVRHPYTKGVVSRRGIDY
ncbi:MAG: cob(I)yrinic acid a,c-diamide adenosyltransferase [Synergistaceae bacterium]|nr:cob(I)yrinic acid a,c-diamide adenosyltransferase [Synergistaceae bacterium]